MSEVAQVPQLRFPEFNGDLEEKKLDDVGSFKSGTGFTEAEQGGKSGVPFFKVSDMNLEGNQKVMVSANNYVNDEQIARLNYKPINKKSVIFAKVGAAVFLERKRIADSFLIDNNMMAFTPTEDIDFIRQWFDTVRLSKYAQVGALPSYNASDLKTIKINLPALPEQTKIASFLTTVDNKIEQLSKKQELLGEYKKGLMQQIFSQVIRFKADDGCDFPDWKEKKLGDVGNFYRGHSYNSTNVKDSGLLVLRSSNIKNDSLILDNDLQFVNKDCSDNISLKTNDIVICMANGSKRLVGKSGIYHGDYNGKLTVGAFCSIFRTDNLLSKYILQTVQYRKYLHILLAGTNINNLKNSELSELTFNLPVSSFEQTKIASFLSSIDNKIEQVDKQLDESKQFKKALLQQMFV